MSNIFGSDRVLLYDVDPWNRLGFGVPNFGSTSKIAGDTIETIGTLNVGLHSLADEIGKSQLFIMTHTDAMRTQPPSRNTLERIGKLLNRVQTVLASRMMVQSDVLLEEGHQKPAPKIWTIHPVPYFTGPFLRNSWLMQYNELVMTALTNFYQHSDNNLAMTITARFARDIYQYFREIKIRMGTELLLLKREDVQKDDFMFVPAMFDKYDTESVVLNIEALDTPGNMFTLPTEQDLLGLMRGIPANVILPNLKQYPIGPVPGSSGNSGEDTIDEQTAATGTGGIGGGGGANIGNPVI